MIGVIGVGGAGGNIADEAQKNGFLSAAINFSQKDLDCIDVKHKLRLSGSEGVGKNRDQAISHIQEQWEVAAKFIHDHFSNVDCIIFAFSSSGGTGSGITPLLIDVVTAQMPDKVVSTMVILPDLSEATVSQINCLKTFEELSRLPISIFAIDNQQVKLAGIGKNKMFELTNQKAIELLKKISSYTDKHSKNGNFDKKDFLTVLSTQGIAIMSEVEITNINRSFQLSTKWVSEQVQESFINSIFVPVEFEKVIRAAVIFDGQEGLMEFIDHQSIFSEFDNGIVDLFEGNYHENNGKLYTILTGLNWCNKRLNDIEVSLDTNKAKVESALTVQKEYQTSKGDFLSKLRAKPQEVKRSVVDILSKYKR